MATKDKGPDLKGDRGGDTGHTKQVGKGEQAEKGDERREEMGNEGPTRPGAQGGHHSQSGSHSNESK